MTTDDVNFPPSSYDRPGAYPPPSPPPLPRHPHPAGLGVRLLARLIDGILVNLAAFMLSVVLLAPDSWVLATGLFSGVLMFGYFVLFEVTRGATPGKMMLGLAVRGAGNLPKPDAKQSAIRNAFTLLTLFPYIGNLLALIAYIVIAVTISASPTKQGKHDELAGGTQVVSC
ncbi:RDD family protein [Mycobacterium botniense]|uniref:RDD family protein n=1 Tax=Mycobacterium botniense TaxID=84962 RepID=A0A7I9Y1R7_9MYCO|nr:RDD family protein [Mycobacterium botniense]GFG75813.1 RDD family protein [Mycobacterium botniense]